MWVRLAGEPTHLYTNAKDTLSNMPTMKITEDEVALLLLAFHQKNRYYIWKMSIIHKKTHVIFFNTLLFVISLQTQRQNIKTQRR